MIFREGGKHLLDPCQIWQGCSDRSYFLLLSSCDSQVSWYGMALQNQPSTTKISFRFLGQTWSHTKRPRQVRTSNVVVVYAIVFETLSSVYGIANLTEHPNLISRHAWFAAPFIWIMEQVRRLQALPNVHAHHLQHCKFGGTTRNPTKLMMVHIAKQMTGKNEKNPQQKREDKEATTELRKVERPRIPTGCLIGKNADGFD